MEQFHSLLYCQIQAQADVIKKVVKNDLGNKLAVTRECLRICVTFKKTRWSDVKPSGLLHKIQDGSLLRVIEAAVFTQDFVQLMTDVCGVEVKDDNQRLMLSELLHEFEIKLLLKLSGNMLHLINLLFLPQPSEQDITLTLQPMRHGSRTPLADQQFEELQAALRNIILVPVNRRPISDSQGSY